MRNGLLDRARVEVERDHLVLGVAANAVNHVPAHLSQPHKADRFHVAAP